MYLSLRIFKEKKGLDSEFVLNEVRALYLLSGTAVEDTELCHPKDFLCRTNSFPAQADFCTACDCLRNLARTNLHAACEDCVFKRLYGFQDRFQQVFFLTFTIKLAAHWWAYNKNKSKTHFEF